MGRTNLSAREKESKLRMMIGDRKVDKLLSYAFEYACREASFLCLAEHSQTLEQYQNAFNTMCLIRRNLCVCELYDKVIDAVCNKGVYSGHVKVDIDMRCIEGKIHSDYAKRLQVEQRRLLTDGKKEGQK